MVGELCAASRWFSKPAPVSRRYSRCGRTGTLIEWQRRGRLSGLRPAFAQSQHAGAGGMTFTLPRPGPTFGLDAVAGQPRTERRDKHRAHPVWTPWDRIGLGVDQRRVAHLIPGKHNLFIAGVQTFGPEIARITGLPELRVGHGDGRVEKLGIDCTKHGGLQPAHHRNIVRVYSPASFCQLALHIENMARPAWRRQDAPKGSIRREAVAVVIAEPNDRVLPGQDHAVRIYSAHNGLPQVGLIPRLSRMQRDAMISPQRHHHCTVGAAKAIWVSAVLKS